MQPTSTKLENPKAGFKVREFLRNSWSTRNVIKAGGKWLNYIYEFLTFNTFTGF